MHKITERFNTHFQYTITAYGKDIEPGVPSIDESIKTLLELEKQVGKQRICWRYDPVLLTKKYTIERHLKTFEYMAKKLAGHVDRCIESRNIGAYDTCLNGCKYCYANQSPQKAFENYKFHNENSPLLLGILKQTDIVVQGSQKSYLSKDQPHQMELNI